MSQRSFLPPNSKSIQDDKLLLRLSSNLTAAMDQSCKEQLPGLNRSEFIRRCIRFTLDNMEQFKSSEASTVSEAISIEGVEKINAIREYHEELTKYTGILMKEPGNAVATVQQIKQLAFIFKILGTMVFRIADPV